MGMSLVDKIIVLERAPISIDVVHTFDKHDLQAGRSFWVLYENLGPGTITDLYLEESADNSSYTKINASDLGANLVPLGRASAAFSTTRPSFAVGGEGKPFSRVKAVSDDGATLLRVTVNRIDDGHVINPVAV